MLIKSPYCCLYLRYIRRVQTTTTAAAEAQGDLVSYPPPPLGQGKWVKFGRSEVKGHRITGTQGGRFGLRI